MGEQPLPQGAPATAAPAIASLSPAARPGCDAATTGAPAPVQERRPVPAPVPEAAPPAAGRAPRVPGAGPGRSPTGRRGCGSPPAASPPGRRAGATPPGPVASAPLPEPEGPLPEPVALLPEAAQRAGPRRQRWAPPHRSRSTTGCPPSGPARSRRRRACGVRHPRGPAAPLPGRWGRRPLRFRFRPGAPLPEPVGGAQHHFRRRLRKRLRFRKRAGGASIITGTNECAGPTSHCPPLAGDAERPVSRVGGEALVAAAAVG